MDVWLEGCSLDFIACFFFSKVFKWAFSFGKLIHWFVVKDSLLELKRVCAWIFLASYVLNHVSTFSGDLWLECAVLSFFNLELSFLAFLSDHFFLFEFLHTLLMHLIPMCLTILVSLYPLCFQTSFDHLLCFISLLQYRSSIQNIFHKLTLFISRKLRFGYCFLCWSYLTQLFPKVRTNVLVFFHLLVTNDGASA